MDKKTWIVVTLCVIGLLWHQSQLKKQNEAYRAQLFAEQQRLAAEEAANPQPVEANPSPGVTTPGTPGTLDPAPAVPEPSAPEETVMLKTDEIDFVFTSNGGGLKQVDLHSHKRKKGGDHIILNEEGKAPLLAIGPGSREPILTPFAITSANEQQVVLTGELSPGVTLRKTFSKQMGEEADPHILDVSIAIENNSAQPIDLGDHYAYLGAASPLQKTEWIRPAMFWQDNGDAEKRDVTKFKASRFLFVFPSGGGPKTEIVESVSRADWAGSMNQYFTLLLRPKEPLAGRVWARKFTSSLAEIENVDPTSKSAPTAIHGGLSLGEHRVAAGQSLVLNYDLYAGPKEYRRLTGLGEGRGSAMFYGFFTPISKTLMWLTSKIHDFVPNWGWSIILMTLIIRTVIWPLHAKSQRTMKRMSLLAPIQKELKEKYGDDPQKMNVEVMKLYKEYGVNPMGGCLPMFLQIPIFFGFYRMLQSAAELRGAEWFWAKDLSMPDTVMQIAGFPLNPLPIVMGLTMFLQMAIAPKTGDKMQQRIFMFMPLMFLGFCYNFASALALYWTAQNIFSIFQTWYMRSQPDPVLEKRAAAAGGKGGSGKGKGKGGKPSPKKAKGLGGLALAPPPEDPKAKKKKRPPRTGG